MDVMQSDTLGLKNVLMNTFHTTPLLPTYLLAFVISKFESKSKLSKNLIDFRAFSRGDQIGNVDFGIESAIQALDKFETNFDMKYESMTKLDQVALPVFNFGGMENHGIVFYREDFLLYDDKEHTAYDKEYVAQTVVHEICHKFLGNLLTPHWWSVLWLSEGFCKLYEYYMIEPIYADMRMEELFAIETLQSVMIRDASPTIRAMTTHVETPSQVRSIFDSVAYSKSACVIRMFLHALTPELFNKGLHNYLSKETTESDGVAHPVDLYEALQSALPENTQIKVKPFFESWEHQAGFPYLTIERNYNGKEVKFRQRRFVNSDADFDTFFWHIPITYMIESEGDFANGELFWSNERVMEKSIDGLRSNKFIVVNIDQQGYYRVLYDNANWMMIANFLYDNNFNSLSSNTRAMLIDDSYVFAGRGEISLKIFLEIIKYLENDSDWIPWYTATYNMVYMRRMLDDGKSKLYQDFRAFLRRILQKVYITYGVEVKNKNEPHHHKHIRNIAINWACQAHLPECLEDTAPLLIQTLQNPAFEITIDHRSTILCYGAVKANESVYLKLWNQYQAFYELNHDQEALLYLRTIGYIENETILRHFIKRYKDTPWWLTLIQAVYANGPIGLRVAVDFLGENFDEFSRFIISGNRFTSLNSIFTGIANRVVTREMYAELVMLMALYEIPTTTQNTASTTIVTNLGWIEKNSVIIQDFLDGHKNSAEKIAATSVVVMATMMLLHKFLL